MYTQRGKNSLRLHRPVRAHATDTGSIKVGGHSPSGRHHRVELAKKLVNTIRRRIDVVRHIARHAAARPDADAIHESRVATRRAREAVGVLTAGKFVKQSDAAVIVRLLRKLRRRGGELRDIDVFLEALPHNIKPGDGLELSALTMQVQDRRAKVVRAFVKSAMAVASNRRIARCEQLLDRMDMSRLGDALNDAVISRAMRNRKRLLRSIELAVRQNDIRAMHQARIAGKRLRYMCEISDDAAVTKCGSLRTCLRHFQKIAGALHDADAAMARLDDFDHSRSPAAHGHNALIHRLKRSQRVRIPGLKSDARTVARGLYKLVKSTECVFRRGK